LPRFFFLLFLFCAFIWLSGCVPTRNLKSGEYLLYNQQITGNKNVKTDNLSAFYKQKPNRKLAGIQQFPYLLWIYNIGLKSYHPEKIQEKITTTTQHYDDKIATLTDSVKIQKCERLKEKKLHRLRIQLEQGNYLMRVPGEPPVMADTALARQGAEQMALYLKKKGFFLAQTRFRIDRNEKKRRANVTYEILENQPYRLGKTEFVTDNPLIDSILQANKDASLLIAGQNYDEDKINAERDRVDKLLRNNGFFYFSKQYVEFFVHADTLRSDSATATGPVEVEVTILNPDKQPHHRYRISEVTVITDAGLQLKQKRDTITFRQVKFASFQQKFSVRSLNSRVTLRPGAWYSQQNVVETQKRLGGIDIFKFANPVFDTTGGRLRARIFASPLERFQTTEDIGGTVSQGLPGPAIGLNFKVRNVFRGLGIFEVNARGAIEGQTGVTERTVYATKELGLSTSLTYPKMFMPTQLRFKFDAYNPRTRLSLSYNISDRVDFQRSTLRGTMTYNWETDKGYRRYQFSLVDLSAVTAPQERFSQSFRDYLTALGSRNDPLINSFTNGFISGIGFTYTYNDINVNINRVSRYWRVSAESGGTLLNFLNVIDQSTNDRIFDRQFYRFYRLSMDFRHYRPVTPGSYVVLRVNSGLAGAYGNTPNLPYEKFFFAGGSNSIRAWAPRRLGLGSAAPVQDSTISQTLDNPYYFEQPGNILLELNAEYRFTVFRYLKMAFFADGGNIWKLIPLEKRPGADFDLTRFYKEIALGAGTGFRLDFTFLIIRLDLATKIYNPNRPEGSRWVQRDIWGNLNPFQSGGNQQTVLNIGIGYPF
jgi:outer membrane protein insertion porin family